MASHNYTRAKSKDYGRGDGDNDDSFELQESLLPSAHSDERGSQDSPRNSIDSVEIQTQSKPLKKRNKWFARHTKGEPREHDQGKVFRRRVRIGVIASTWAVIIVLVARWSINWFWPADVKSEPWYPSPPGGTIKSWVKSYEKAAAMVSRMSLPEKVNITSGIGWSMGMCVGNTGPALNAGFPALCYQDGPLGVRFADNITGFPAGITVAATWNKKLMYARGEAHGKEARLKGVNVLLSPVAGPLGRHPAGGRNWEGFSPDSYLTGVASAETIKGIQSSKVIATIKHYILNEQEHFRQALEWGPFGSLSSNIDDRTLHELYLWPFADAVKAGVGSVMCSYQRINNTQACGNSKLMNGILKDELGFQGFVQSDWLAKRTGIQSALAGLDVDMPGDGLSWADGKSLWGSHLTKAVLNESLPLGRLNDMVTRIVATWYQMGQDDKDFFPVDFGPNFSSWENTQEGYLHFGSGDNDRGVVNKFINVQEDHKKLVKQIDIEGTVLVKNENCTLPLDVTKYKKVGIYGLDLAMPLGGPNACPDKACNTGTLISGWGSGSVELPYLISPQEALEARLQKAAPGINVSTIASNTALNSIRKSAMEQDLCLVFINADGGEGYKSSDNIQGDRNDLLAQKGGDKMANEVVHFCKNTVVVIHAIGPVTVEDWVDHIHLKSLLYAHLPSQESGNAITDVLFGDANPSGKLPYTIGRSLDSYGPGAKIMYYPPNAFIPQMNFSDGVYIDYRYFDKHNITPRYEFGFGLSYTEFAIYGLAVEPTTDNKTALPPTPPKPMAPPSYSTKLPSIQEALFPPNFRKINKYIYPYINSASDISFGKPQFPTGYSTSHTPSPAGGGEGGNPYLWDIVVTVTVEVINTGFRKGSEVVQLYIGFPDNEPRLATGEDNVPEDEADEAHWKKTQFVDFPVKQLRGFEKVELDVGGKQEVKFEIRRRDVSYWCVVRQNWIMPMSGKFKIWVGNSSRNLELETEWWPQMLPEADDDDGDVEPSS